MSVAKMIASHPDVAGQLNEPLAEAIRHAMFTAALATSCADACVAEPSVADMRACVRSCSDLADVAAMFVAVATRRTASNQAVLRDALALLKTAAESALEETGKHEQDHCARMHRMCREMLDDLVRVTL